MTSTCVLLLFYLRGHCFGKEAKLRRLPTVRKARPRMTKVQGVHATKAPEGFGLSADEIAAVDAKAAASAPELMPDDVIEHI